MRISDRKVAMGMTDLEIEAAKHDLEHDMVQNAAAADRCAIRAAGEWASLNKPKPVTDSILDADPKMAAWLWAREHFILVNEEEIDFCISDVVPARYAEFDVEVTCYDKHTVTRKVILIKHIGDVYKVAAVVDDIYI